MHRRTINLLAVAAAVGAFVWVASGLVAGGDEAPVEIVTEDAPAPTPSPAKRTAPVEAARALQGYALSIPEVDGLPTDLEPGQRLDLYAAWDPPVSKEPTIRLLVEDAIYERTIPPLVEGQPLTAVVLVPASKVGTLMYGDRYGSLSASLDER